jgi:peroxiredoxin/Flp pilus assembly protein TadD
MTLAANVASQEQPEMQVTPFVLKTLDGKEHSLQELLTSKLVAVVFWSTWGKDSGRVLGNMEELWQQYQSKGLAVIGVCVEEQNISAASRQKIADSIQRNNITFPIVLDDGLQTFRAYSVIAVPTTYVTDKTGKILYKLSGYPISGRTALRDYIVERFEGKRAPVVITAGKQPASKEVIPLYRMARSKLEQGQLESARKYAEKAWGLDSMFADTYTLLAEIRIEQDSLQLAEDAIKQLLSLAPASVDGLRLKGLLLAKKGHAQAALDILAPLVRTDSLAALTRCFNGYALGMRGDCSKSLYEFSRAEALARDDYRIPQLRAEIYRRCGMKEEAQGEEKKVRLYRRGR